MKTGKLLPPEDNMMGGKLVDLIAIGFELAGEWKLEGEGIDCEMNELAAARNVLYAFAICGEVMYVGKTVQPLRTRMAGYKKPGPTQLTNIRNNGNIRESLERGRSVEVYVLPDNGLLHYGRFHVNLAAGLEDSVVRELDPPWNGGQKESRNETLQPIESA